MRRLYAMVSAAALAVAMLVVPASAHPNPVVAVCQGDATVSNPLTFTTPTGFDWEFKGECDTDGDGVNDSTIEARGTGASGICGASSAPHNGTGEIKPIAPNTHEQVNLSKLGWTQSAGTVLPVTGEHDHNQPMGPTVTATVQASGGQACLTGATHFDVNIVATLS